MTITICDGYKSKEEDDIHNVTLFYHLSDGYYLFLFLSILSTLSTGRASTTLPL